MWTPTHVQILVNQARNLCSKGKAGTNDAYVVIQLEKEKYQTSIRERSIDPSWNEECSFPVDAELKKHTAKITIFHRNLLGLDEFLGQVTLPLADYPVYEKPKARWYQLNGKPSSSKPEKARGEVEVTVMFYVQNVMSHSELSLNDKSTTNSGRRVSIKNFANSLGDKLSGKRWASRNSISQKSLGSGAYSTQSMLDLHAAHLPRSLNFSAICDSIAEDVKSTSRQSLNTGASSPTETITSTEHRASVASMSEDVTDAAGDVFCAKVAPLSQSCVSATVSPDHRTLSALPEALRAADRRQSNSLSRICSEDPAGSLPKSAKKNWLLRKPNKSNGKCSQDESVSSEIASQSLQRSVGRPCRSADMKGGGLSGGVAAYELQELHDYLRKKQTERQTMMSTEASSQILEQFNNYEKEDLIRLMLEQQSIIERKESYIHDLEDYIDNLLVRVIESEPRLLQNPYEPPAISRSRDLPSRSHDFQSYGSRTLPLSSSGMTGSSVTKSVTQNCINMSAVSKPGVYVPGSRFPSLGGVNKVGGKPSGFKSVGDKTKRGGGLIVSPLKKLSALIS